MNKHKLLSVLKHTGGILTASFMLELLDLSQASSSFEYLLTYLFWGKLLGLFFIYLVGAYLLIYFSGKAKPEVTKR